MKLLEEVEEEENERLVLYQDSDTSAQYCFIFEPASVKKKLKNNQLDECYLQRPGT